MNHQRHVIREALTALLAAGNTPALQRVYEHPYAPRRTFPALVVEDVGERQEPDEQYLGGVDAPVFRRLLLEVSVEVQQSERYARQRDQLLADVEVLFAQAAANNLAGVKSITPAGYAADLSTEGEQPIAIGRQRFEVLYITTVGNPSIPL